MPHKQIHSASDRIFQMVFAAEAVSKEVIGLPSHVIVRVEILSKEHLLPINYSEQVTNQTSGELQTCIWDG